MIFVALSDNLIHTGVWIKKNWTPRMMLMNQNFSNPSGRMKKYLFVEFLFEILDNIIIIIIIIVIIIITLFKCQSSSPFALIGDTFQARIGI